MFLRSSMFPSSGGQKATRSIVNRFTQAAWTPISITSNAAGGAISANSGAMTADTLKTLLSVSGVGTRVSHLSFRTADSTSRTIRVQITVDGIVVCNSTSSAITVGSDGGFWAGSRSNGDPPFIPEITSNSTLLIEYASSLTETDKIIAEYIYNTEA